MIVVTSYTQFDNLAHGPRGTEAAHSIFTYELDTTTGELLLLHINDDDKGICNPAFTRLHPYKNVLYCCTESVVDNGKIVAWELCPKTGELTHMSTTDAQGTSTCYITIDKQAKNALIVNYWNATVVVVGICPDTGAMLESKAVYDPNQGRQMAVKATKHVNHSLNDSSAQRERQLDPHSHAIILDPYFGKIAFVPDLGMDIIRMLVFDDVSGKLYHAGNVKSGSPGRTALGPRYIEFHPTLKVAYVVNELSSEVAVFRFDTTAAQNIIDTAQKLGTRSAVKPCMELVQDIKTIPDAFPGRMNTCGRICVHSSGRFVLVSNRGHDSMAIYPVDRNTGLLHPPTFQHTRGETPRHFQFDASGQWLIVANQDSDTIGVFQFNVSTGELTFTGNEYRVPSPNFVCCIEPRLEDEVVNINSAPEGKVPAPAPPLTLMATSSKL